MSDYDVIKQLEKELNREIKKIYEIKWDCNGYFMNRNKQITGLGLNGYEINNIEIIFLELKNLTHLYLSQNQINDIANIKNLKNLTHLNLSENQISDISPLNDFKNLTRLDVKYNRISDISHIKNLKNLKRLDINNNPIKELPTWITDFNMNIQWKNYVYEEGFISFFENPLQTPPIEIVKQGKEAIRNYFQQLKEQEDDYLFEAKMLILGEPGAGKTSMAWKIKDENCVLPHEDKTTRGVEVEQYYFPLLKDDFPNFKHPEKMEGRNFRVNLWDFGGQEIYKATHRFFLSNRSLYALVADSRNEDTDFNYWLHIVEMFGGESPLIITLNEKHQRKRNIDIDTMRKRFTNIADVKNVDFAEKDKTRLKELKKAIRFYITQLPHIGSPVPSKWTIIRDAIDNDFRNTITIEEYLDICKKNGISKTEDAFVLSSYFHDIGVFLHFQNDELLRKTIFLKPNWATSAVYKILDHKLLNKKNGKFTKNDAKKIWKDGEYKLVQDELLKLMQKFFLTYEIDDSGEFIVPERLNPISPAYDWNKEANLFLSYKYDVFMPKGIMSMFIVRKHKYITNQEHVWRRGVVLCRGETFAEIVESYDSRTIKIRIHGKNRRDFMTIITEELDTINAQYEKMKVDKLIPCNCDTCNAAKQPYFFGYDKLKRRLENSKYEIECEISYEKVNIRRLMSEVIYDEKYVYNETKTISASENRGRGKVFVSYSHNDKDWLEKIQTHLKGLENEGISVNLWDDTKIKPGMKWKGEIEKALKASKVAILLVSAEFLASEFIKTNELPGLLKAAENDGATILPLILKPCRFSSNKKLSDFQAVNDAKKPLSTLKEHEQDEILVNLTGRIAELMSES